MMDNGGDNQGGVGETPNADSPVDQWTTRSFEFPSSYSPVEPALPTGVSRDQVQSAARSFIRSYLDTYLAFVPGTAKPQAFIDWYAVERQNPSAYSWIEDYRYVTVSEAHGYGMLAVVLGGEIDPSYTDAQADFDAMYNYFKAFPSIYDSRLMGWRQIGEGLGKSSDVTLDNLTGVKNVSSASNATDGDLDIAYALLLADDVWGSDGDIDYQEAALSVIDGIREKNLASNGMIELGDWANGKLTRSSDFMLGHLRAFAQADTENASVWEQSFSLTVNIIKETFTEWSPETGLLPDFLTDTGNGFEPARRQVLESPMDGDYNYNAARVPWRLTADYFSSGDDVVLEMLKVNNRWIQEETNRTPNNIKVGYVVRGQDEKDHGTPLRDVSWTDLTFTAPFLPLSAIEEDGETWRTRMWNSHKSDGSGGTYFGESIQLHSLLVFAGYWRLPEPN